ncbi:MAG: excinuclease ABC subunit UvrC [Candidatus Izemoplasmataceae bacterium]
MIKDKLKLIPSKPGSYQMKDSHGNIIYVGKAKNLKNRLTTYFTGSHDYKTTKMVQAIADFEYIVTNTELEALILEIDLIKKYSPRFNILLTDDKSYPYIEITKERHPKLVVTRPMNKTNKNLFGPYPNVKAARDTLRLLNKLYPLRKCHKLPNEPCLYYHLGQCLAPCIHKVEVSTYQDIASSIARFLKGDNAKILKSLEEKMYEASQALEFERAQEYKTTIEAIKTTTEQQVVNLSDLKDRDIIALASDEDHVAIEIFFIRNGKINARDKTLIPYYVDKDQAALDYLIQFYQAYPIPSEVLSNQAELLNPLEALFDTRVITPQKGEKKKLLDLAIVNAKQSLSEQVLLLKRKTEKTFGALDELSELLNIPTPYHIEAFDNSHLFGTYPVSSMVVFKNAVPSKKDYRKYKLDYEANKQSGDTMQMEEVLYRRYQKVLLEDLKRPDLILVDGGIHQLNTAKKVISSLGLKIPIAGLVKNEKHKTSHIIDMNDSEISISNNSKLFLLLSFIQDEAHRFAVTFHKDLRSKGIYATILDKIDGVGDKTKKKLLNHFKTIQNMKQARFEDFKALHINEPTIKNIMAALREEDKVKS